MPLSNGQIPLVANVAKNSVGRIQASSNIATMGSDANGVDIFVAGAQGGRVNALIANTDDTVASNIYLWILDALNVVKPLGLLNVPLSSGNTNGVKAVDALDGATLPGFQPDNTGKRFINLAPNEKLRGGSLVGLSPGKSTWLTAIGADYQP